MLSPCRLMMLSRPEEGGERDGGKGEARDEGRDKERRGVLLMVVGVVCIFLWLSARRNPASP